MASGDVLRRLEGREYRIGHRVHLTSVGGDAEVSQRLIERIAHLHELGQLRQRIDIVEQWPVAALANAFHLLLERRAQVHDEAALAQYLAILLEQDGATAGGEHDRGLARDVLEYLALAYPKSVLAFA